MNSINTKIRPNHNTEIWQIRSSSTFGKYTQPCYAVEIFIKNYELLSFYYNTMILRPKSVSSLCGQNYENLKLQYNYSDQYNSADRKSLLII